MLTFRRLLLSCWIQFTWNVTSNCYHCKDFKLRFLSYRCVRCHTFVVCNLIGFRLCFGWFLFKLIASCWLNYLAEINVSVPQTNFGWKQYNDFARFSCYFTSSLHVRCTQREREGRREREWNEIIKPQHSCLHSLPQRYTKYKHIHAQKHTKYFGIDPNPSIKLVHNFWIFNNKLQGACRKHIMKI